ncbi:MAG TPA: hypothetical protein G4O17_05860 [Dehalococcoidia bacterium]|jgi:hypothetical protein|nr:hypothetical protein [Dehalococcoidia bacterium]
MQNALFIIIGLGILALIGWAAKGFFVAAEISIFIRIVVGVITVAVVALLGIVIKQRIAQAREEDFKEVEK